MRTAVISWDATYNASSYLTLQYRKVNEIQWSELKNLNGRSVTLSSLEPLQTYTARLMSPRGILMLKKYVYGGGKYSDEATVLMKKGKYVTQFT